MDLDRISDALDGQPDLPPIQQWHPQLSGDIDIRIAANGDWIHEGAPINRQSLVRLFASILRREADGQYYLVTPVEKWRIQVDDVPLQIIDFEIRQQDSADAELVVETNVGRYYVVGDRYPLSLGAPAADGAGETDTVPVVELDNGLCARFTRPAYYRLVDSCESRDGRLQLVSGGRRFTLGEW